MHLQVRQFLQNMKARYPDAFVADRVLECGALDINGSPREFFVAKEYVGVDIAEGPGVDEISLIHQYESSELFDTIVSTEMLEHDPHWRESLGRMVELLKPGGSLILTWAGPFRPPHELQASPTPGYYRGLSAADVRDALSTHVAFTELVTEELPGDVRIFATGKQARAACLTSIIVLTYNGLRHTITCLDSIKANTPETHEIIIVDNASTDGTVEWLKEHADDRGLRVIASKRNQGFAGGNNWGLALAAGDVVVLLNNDVVVTPGWLGRLCLPLYRYPHCGLAGPMSNFVSGPQLLETPGYHIASREGLEEFSASWAAAHMGQSIVVQRLVGFCLAIRRDVLDAIGGLDERFWPGNFEDDDYSLRALLAGFELRIARDCYVHHVGHVAFSNDGIDLQAALATNQKRFREKWGIPLKITGRFELALPPYNRQEHYIPLPRLVQRPEKLQIDFDPSNPVEAWPEISLLMIVRDEAANLEACLTSCWGLWTELIIVDTGSKDDTVRIAEDLGAKVIHRAWDDDFSAARNAGLREATCPWIFWMDADDRLSPDAREALKMAAASGMADAFTCRVDSKVVGQAVQYVTCTHMRLFRRLPGLAWEGSCHEDITPSIVQAGLSQAQTNIVIDHLGYAGGLEMRQQKALRNRDILLREIASRPGDMRLRYLLGVSLYVLGDIAGAVEHMRDVVTSNTPALNADHELYQAHVLLVSGNNTIGRPDIADEALERALRRYPESRHLWTIAAVHHIERLSFDDALEALDRAEGLPVGGNRWPDGTIESYREYIEANRPLVISSGG